MSSSRFTSEYFLEASPRYSVESLNAFMEGQAPEMVLKVQEALAPMFRRMVRLTESRRPIEFKHVDVVYNKIAEFREQGIPDEFLEEGVARGIVEGWGSTLAGAGIGLMTGGPVGALVGGGIGVITSLLGGLFSRASEGTIKSLENAGIRWIMKGLGLDADHGFALYVANVLTQTGLTGIVKLFTDCHFLVGVLVKALPPFIIQSCDFGKGVMSGIVMNIVNDALQDTNLLSSLTASLENTVCGKLGQVGSKLAQKAQAKGITAAPQAPTEHPLLAAAGYGAPQAAPQQAAPVPAA